MTLRPFISFISFLLIISFISCNQKESTNQKSTEEEAELQKLKSKEKADKIKKIFFSLPSPLELTLLFKKEGVEYQSEELHKVANVDQYVTTVKKALNLGIYGADLSYSGLFTKYEDAIRYFSASQILAEDLGIGQTFQREFVTRLERNANNKDTLLQVISDFFLENDSYLKDNNQQIISTYVLIGGWIEGMYLGSSMITDQTNANGIKEIITGQLNSLDNLLILLKNTGRSNDLEQLRSDMVLLRSYYDEIIFKEIDSSLATLEDSNLVIHNEGIAGLMADSTFTKVHDIVKEIRTSITR